MARLLRLRSSIGQITCIFRLPAKKRFFPHWIHFVGRNVTCGNKLLHWLGKHTFILVYMCGNRSPLKCNLCGYTSSLTGKTYIHTATGYIRGNKSPYSTTPSRPESRIGHQPPPSQCQYSWVRSHQRNFSIKYKYSHILIQMTVSKDLISLPQRFFC